MSGATTVLEMVTGVLLHLQDGVSPPATDPAEDEETVVAAGPVAGQVVHHHTAVREQNVETAQLAVQPEIEKQKVRK